MISSKQQAKRPRFLVRAAAWGAVSFTVLSTAIGIANVIWHGEGGTMAMAIVVSVPTALFMHITGLRTTTHLGGFALAALINGCLGAAAFVTLAWLSINQKDDEDPHSHP